MPRTNRLQFTEKKHSKRALIGLLLAAASLAGLVILLAISTVSHGESSAYIGSGGLYFLLTGIIALYFTVPTLRDENSFPTLPRIGTAMSVIACLLWGGLYAWGFVYGG